MNNVQKSWFADQMQSIAMVVRAILLVIVKLLRANGVKLFCLTGKAAYFLPGPSSFLLVPAEVWQPPAEQGVAKN